MINEFIRMIDELYDIINEPIDKMFKYTAINNYKKKLGITDGKFSDIFIKILNNKKSNGVVYTPQPIASYMVSNLIKVEDVISNPYLKVLDPSCGCGNILIPLIYHLESIFKSNIDEINKKNNLDIKKDGILKHILTYNVHGCDIDETSIKILIIDVFTVFGYIHIENYIVSDFLLDEKDTKYDFIVANPPYVGHKNIEREYFLALKKKYGNLYKDKSDLSFCFFQKGINVINKHGKITFITSRYFMESPSGEDLRKVLKEYCSVFKIVDFYGIRPFKNIGIDPVIIFLINSSDAVEEIEVFKPNINVKNKNSEFYNSLFLKEGTNFNYFKINKNLLNNKGWVLRNKKEREIIRKIEEKSLTNLSNICNSYQGIITGLDKAFVVTQDIIDEYNLEKDIIMPWVKSTSIQKSNVLDTGKYLIYSDKIEDEKEYPNCIKYISQFKEKLMLRRECRLGRRKWYQLQWGRKEFIFKNKKIIFPYKSQNNRFSLDKGKCFSADIYALALKEDIPITYDFLLYLLNSKVYEFYFKCFTKKLGENMYEYYPNNVSKLCIPICNIIDYSSEDRLNEFFGFSTEEIEIINSYI
ncbi:TaqI-like C-terminal specificity domain-containing protein [Clostridium sediminicola]|uniref:Eco57I restriction-modification methylase domain-containing protein n=1 Tax=Clostridium sediminicola TaxID=3114879 RepID=UPI0031F20632